MLNNNRTIDYLRISVTDRCNLRCIYCVPEEGVICKPREQILSFEEILRLVKILVGLGIKKVRLTGGEPLMRKNILSLIHSLKKLDGLDEVCLTTNASLLAFYAYDLRRAGVDRINISLDTLKRDKFREITRGGELTNVLEGIRTATEAGFEQLKLNVVAMRGINDDEIIDFVDFAKANNLILRFIEFMRTSPLWHKENLIPIKEVKEICESKFTLKKAEYVGNGPARYYENEQNAIIGFINTTENNCQKCNRLRLTACGELKVCLYEQHGLLLRNTLREGIADEALKKMLVSCLGLKENVNYTHGADAQFYMCKVGG